MEECDGGEASSKSTGYGSVQNLIKNKLKGGKRTSPQVNPDVRREPKLIDGRKLFKCPRCDFISQNETEFNEHIVKAHAGQPTCPFCFFGAVDYPSLRKHIEMKHKELRNTEQAGAEPRIEVNRKPCRYFKNGEGQCTPRYGKCLIILSYHSIKESFAATKSNADLNLFVSISILKVKTLKFGR